MYFDETAWVAIAFLMFIALVWKKGSKAITDILDNRSLLIENELKEAKSLKEEALEELRKSLQNQKNISANFAKKNPDWNDLEYKILKNGNPIIKNCVSNLDCKILNKIKKGDHIIFICKVLKVSMNDNLEPLIYFNSRYL